MDKEKEVDEKLLKSIKFPDKPRLGKVSKWLLFLIYFVVVVGSGIMIMRNTDIAVCFFAGGIFIVFLVAFLIECYGIFIVYLKETKEYDLAQADFKEYQHYMVKKITKDLTINKEYSEDLAKTYGKQKKHNPAAMTFINQPNGKIRP